MAGCRALTAREERALIRIARRGGARNRALITTQLFTGYRAFEVVSLRVGQVWREGGVVPRIGLPPRNRKGRRGNTHWVPVGRELTRALEAYLRRRGKEEGCLDPMAPLFVSRSHERFSGELRAITRKQAYRIIKDAFQRAGIEDDGRLGTHCLRKTFAARIFKFSGYNLLVTRDALGHKSAVVTEMYLEPSRQEIDTAILRSDWTRRPRRTVIPEQPLFAPTDLN